MLCLNYHYLIPSSCSDEQFAGNNHFAGNIDELAARIFREASQGNSLGRIQEQEFISVIPLAPLCSFICDFF